MNAKANKLFPNLNRLAEKLNESLFNYYIKRKCNV